MIFQEPDKKQQREEEEEIDGQKKGGKKQFTGVYRISFRKESTPVRETKKNKEK